MRRLIKNHFKRNKGPQFERLLKSMGFDANEYCPSYCHVGALLIETEFYRANMNNVVIDFNTLTFEPYDPKFHGPSPMIMHRRTLQKWIKEHPHRLTSKKFGI